MTVIAGAHITTSRNNRFFNPNRRPIRFETEEIILAGDSRISLNGLPLKDNGLKVGKLSDSAIAGISGSVRLTKQVMNNLNVPNQIERGQQVAERIGKVLNRQHRNMKARNPQISASILLGTRDTQQNLALFHIATKNNGKPKRVGGVCAIGSGANEFKNRFKEEIDFYVQCWIRRGESSGSATFVDGEPTDFRRNKPPYFVSADDVHMVIGEVLRQQIEEGQIKSVGGKIQVLKLSKQTILRTDLFFSSDDGTTWEKMTPEPEELE